MPIGLKKLENIDEYNPLIGEYIRLDANESPFECIIGSEKIVDIISKSELNRYPDSKATRLCTAFGDKIGVNHNNIVAGNGSDEIISIIINSFFSKGEKITISSPDFSMYNFYAQIAELEIDLFDKEGLDLDLYLLEEHMKSNGSRAVIFSNPCNPTGQIISPSEIISFVRRTGFFAIVDEAYIDFAETNNSILSYVVDDNYFMNENIIVLRTLSKLYGLAGLRIGFAIGSQRIIGALKKAKSPYNVNTLSMDIAEYAIVHLEEEIESRRIYLNDARDEVYLALKQIFAEYRGEVIKTNGNFNLVRFKNAKEVFEKLLKKGIAIRQMGDFIRISVGTAEENETFLTALADVLKSLARC